MNIHSGIFLTVLLVATLTARAETAIHDNPGKPSGTNASETAAIIALEHRDAEAAKINDVETLVSLWTEDGVLLQPRSEPVLGAAAIRKLLEQQKQQSTGMTTLAYEEDWKERRILGEEAYEWGEMSVTARLPDGKETTQTVYAIRVLRRQQDGSWKVARAIITPGPRKN
jgi:uncharacterized protein (TIGR02246 family)